MGGKKNHIIENDIEKEHCPTCNEWKELIEFNKKSSSWYNLAGMCRKCFTEYIMLPIESKGEQGCTKLAGSLY